MSRATRAGPVARRPPVGPVTPEAGMVSVVIPCLNEAAFIGRVIDRLHAVLRPRHRYEILVVDHGSVDGTASIAARHGAKVIEHHHGTVGTLRNVGARRARGEVLVFLDADVLVTRRWGRHLPRVLRRLRESPRLLTGSICDVPAEANRLQRLWFGSRPRGEPTHLGSAHMVITRTFFLRVGGFDETLETGEDYEFSQRVLGHGGRIVDDRALRAEHLGFPRTLRDFVRREIWHGTSDFATLGTIVRSKVALAAAAFLACHATAAVAVIAGRATVAGAAATAIALLCLASSIRRCRGRGWKVVIGNAAIFYLYYCGRALSPFRVRSSRVPGGRRRGEPVPRPSDAR